MDHTAQRSAVSTAGTAATTVPSAAVDSVHAVVRPGATLRPPFWLVAPWCAILAATALHSELPTPTPHGAAVAVLCLALMALPLWPYLGTVPWQRTAILGAACLAAAFDRFPGLGALSVALLLAPAACRATDRVGGLARVLLATTALMEAVVLLEASGLVWQELSRLSWATSYVLTLPGIARERLGPLQLGWASMVFAWCLWLAQVGLARRHTTGLVRLFLVVVVGSLAGIALRQPVFNWIAIGLLAVFGNWRTVNTPRSRPALILGACCLGVAIIGLIMYCQGTSVRSAPRSIAFLSGGLKTFELPSATDLRDKHEAVFGAFTKLVTLYGWRSATLPENFDSRALKDIAILCIINPTMHLSARQHADVETFVRQGGSLLVLGDHTDIGGIRGPLNDLLSFTTIRFNYDSAIPFDENWRWKSSLRGALQPDFWRHNNDAYGISVGASLSCGTHARVLVLGDRCYSDRGNPRYGQSHLGNMTYDLGENFGGLPLAAEERVGAGLVQVWGDTSGFQDISLTHTHTFIAADIEGLVHYRPWKIDRLTVVVTFIALSLIGVLLLRRYPVALLIGLVGAALTINGATQRFDRRLPNPLGQHAAVLDASHEPQYPGPGLSAGLGRLTETFERRTQLLLRSQDFRPTIARAPVWWVIVAPTRPYSAEEAAALKAYVQNGGRLLLIAGYPHRRALQQVLDEFGLDIAADPYGAAHNARLAVLPWRLPVLHSTTPPRPSTGTTSSYDAEIGFRESYPILGKPQIPLVICWEHPIAVEHTYGRGRVILIADSRFCNDENLGREQIDARNVAFLLKCLEE